MKYGEFKVGDLYTYIAKEGVGYSRYHGKRVRLTRKCGKEIRKLEITFIDGPRQNQTRIVDVTELYELMEF